MVEKSDPLGTFEHVVVLMLENRSFDNLLGYLYPSELPDGGRFEGLEGKDCFNPIPGDAPPPQTPTDGDTKTEIRAKQRFTDYHSPYPGSGRDLLPRQPAALGLFRAAATTSDARNEGLRDGLRRELPGRGRPGPGRQTDL